MIKMNDKRKKILVVTHQYTPHVSPRTTRWKLIVEDLINRGHEVIVLTGTKQLSEEKNIIYVGNKRSNSLVSQMREKSNNLTASNFIKKFFYKLLKKIYRIIVKTFAWPDYSMFWLLSIYKNRKNLNIDYDLIVSVSLPFSSHIVAYMINKKKKKEWIMDIGDPYTLKKDAPENNKFLYGYLNKYYENKFYSLANKIIFTHEDAMSAHVEYFDIDKEKTFIGNPISNFKEEIFSRTLEYNYNSLPVKFGYFGVFTKGVRSPKNFITYFKDIKDIELNWYVNDDSKSEIIKHDNELESIFHPLVGREEALKLMASSFHCLVSIGNLNTKQLPSKVIEYISTGKPVIHFCEVENDPVKNISKEFNNLFIVSQTTNRDDLLNQLNLFYKNVSTFKKDIFIQKYTAQSITNILN